MLAYMFPGQGAQAVGMGEELLNDFVTLEKTASDILGYSIKDLCVKDEGKQLNQTEYTQPALFVVSALSYIKVFEENSIVPDYLAGHSLGEYCALFAAEVFDFSTGVRLVQKRGELMSEMRSGSMAAVVSDDLTEVIAIVHERTPGVDIANYNSDVQLVLSGKQDDLQDLQGHLERAGARVIPLAVSGSFHSRNMARSADEFRRFIESVDLHPPKVPVISNVTATPYPEDPDAIRELLADQITSSVRWQESVRYMRQQNVTDFVELGPGRVLSGLLRNIA